MVIHFPGLLLLVVCHDLTRYIQGIWGEVRVAGSPEKAREGCSGERGGGKAVTPKIDTRKTELKKRKAAAQRPLEKRVQVLNGVVH